MKQLVLSILIVGVSLTSLKAQDCITPPNWTITKDTLSNFSKQHDLFFASKEIGYTTGVRGTLRKTADGGKTWDIIHSLEGMGTRAIMRSLYFVTDLIGFAGGDGDFSATQNIDEDADFLRTEDGGLTWEKNIIDGMERIDDLRFFDALHGLAILFSNNMANLLGETHDGGKTWEIIETGISRPEGSKFIHAGERVLLYGNDAITNGTYILLEINEDGTINSTLSAPPTRSTFYFHDEFLGFAFSDDITYKTTDGGVSWEVTNFPQIDVWSVIHFADEDNGIVANTIFAQDTAGWETWSYPNGLEIFSTTNGGQDWDSYVSGPDCALGGRLSHSAYNGEIHFHSGNFNGTYSFDFSSALKETLDNIKIYPNPVADYIYLDNIPSKETNTKIYNLTGQILYNAKATASINTEHLIAGYYILSLSNESHNHSYPFIKK